VPHLERECLQDGLHVNGVVEIDDRDDCVALNWRYLTQPHYREDVTWKWTIDEGNPERGTFTDPLDALHTIPVASFTAQGIKLGPLLIVEAVPSAYRHGTFLWMDEDCT